MILKTSIFSLFICLSTFFLYLGYQDLKEIRVIKITKIDEKKKSNINESVKKDINLIAQESLIEEEVLKDESIEDNVNEIILKVNQNDTFTKLIDPYTKDKKTKQKIINSINKEFDLKKLKVGQKIFIYINYLDNINEISKIVIPLNFKSDLVVKKNRYENEYSVKIINIPITTNLVAQKYSISSSLFEDGQKANVPLAILANVIRLYSFDVDFQRDIRKENQLEILYKVYYNKNRRLISYGEIQYANLILGKNNLEYFLFNTEDGLDYFNKKGKNAQKTLMKTPLDGARISSSFGIRKHPILGYNKKHLGVDFAASTGTPVYAAGNGIIEYAGKNGGYGNYIRIRHNSSYKTAYAHLKNFNKGISSGIRVTQGQIIGYVGSTGRSTGPHLHYEVIYQNKKINPMKMKLPSGKVLKENELQAFQKSSKRIYSDFLFHLFE